MNKIVIFTDSTCDLPIELIKENNLHVMPLHVEFGELTIDDDETLKKGVAFDKEKETGCFPKTAGLSPSDIEKFYRPVLEAGNDIFYIGLSQALSSTYQSIVLETEELREEFPNARIEYLDSMNLSTGIGLLLLKACKLRDDGATMDEIVDTIKSLIPRVRTQFVIRDLQYLYKGGRCSAMASVIGKALRLRPLIQVREGKMGIKNLQIGLLKNAIQNMVNYFIKCEPNTDHDSVFITYSAFGENLRDYIIEEFKKNNIYEKFNHVYTSEAGAVISTHCGPSCIGILFINEKTK